MGSTTKPWTVSAIFQVLLSACPSQPVPCEQLIQASWPDRNAVLGDTVQLERCGSALHVVAVVETCDFDLDPTSPFACPADGERSRCEIEGCSVEHCVAFASGEDVACSCLESCREASDCETGWCRCAFSQGSAPKCVDGCRSDADCNGGACLSSTLDSDDDFHCTSPLDACDPRADECSGSQGCKFDGTRYVCDDISVD